MAPSPETRRETPSKGYPSRLDSTTRVGDRTIKRAVQAHLRSTSPWPWSLETFSSAGRRNQECNRRLRSLEWSCIHEARGEHYKYCQTAYEAAKTAEALRSVRSASWDIQKQQHCPSLKSSQRHVWLWEGRAASQRLGRGRRRGERLWLRHHRRDRR